MNATDDRVLSRARGPRSLPEASRVDAALVRAIHVPPGARTWVAGADHQVSADLLRTFQVPLPAGVGGWWSWLRQRAITPAAVNVVSAHHTLFPHLDILDNLCIGRSPQLSNTASLAGRARALLASFDATLDLHAPAASLTDVQRVAVAMVRALLVPASTTIVDFELTDTVSLGMLSRTADMLHARDKDARVLVFGQTFVDLPWITHIVCARGRSLAYAGPATAHWRAHWAVATANSLVTRKYAIRGALNDIRAGAANPAGFVAASLGLARLCLAAASAEVAFCDPLGEVIFVPPRTSAPGDDPVQQVAREWILAARDGLAPTGAKVANLELTPLLSGPSSSALLLIQPDTGTAAAAADEFVDIFRTTLAAVLEDHNRDRQVAHVQRLETIALMAGYLVHDFNNTLYVIESAARLASRRPDAEAIQRHVGAILTATAQASAITSKLRSLVRGSDASSDTFDFNGTVRDAVALVSAAAGPKVTIADDLCAPSCMIRGDAAALVNMLVNLGMNAVQSLPGGEGRVDIRTHHLAAKPWRDLNGDHHKGTSVELLLEDNGCGMEAHVLRRVFEPFFTTRRNAGGTGLGLSMALRIVREHHGTIDMRSRVNVGTSVRIRIPLEEGRVDGDAPLLERRFEHEFDALDRQASELLCAGLHVLLCDDDPSLLNVEAAVLEAMDMRVTCAFSGEEAVQLFKANPQAFDVVVLDYRMLGINGLECFALLKAVDANVAAMILSAHPGEIDVAAAMRLGVSGVYPKPIEPAMLYHAIACAHARQPGPRAQG